MAFTLRSVKLWGTVKWQLFDGRGLSSSQQSLQCPVPLYEALDFFSPSLSRESSLSFLGDTHSVTSFPVRVDRSFSFCSPSLFEDGTYVEAALIRVVFENQRLAAFRIARPRLECKETWKEEGSFWPPLLQSIRHWTWNWKRAFFFFFLPPRLSGPYGCNQPSDSFVAQFYCSAGMPLVDRTSSLQKYLKWCS